MKQIERDIIEHCFQYGTDWGQWGAALALFDKKLSKSAKRRAKNRRESIKQHRDKNRLEQNDAKIFVPIVQTEYQLGFIFQVSHSFDSNLFWEHDAVQKSKDHILQKIKYWKSKHIRLRPLFDKASQILRHIYFCKPNGNALSNDAFCLLLKKLDEDSHSYEIPVLLYCLQQAFGHDNYFQFKQAIVCTGTIVSGVETEHMDIKEQGAELCLQEGYLFYLSSDIEQILSQLQWDFDTYSSQEEYRLQKLFAQAEGIPIRDFQVVLAKILKYIDFYSQPDNPISNFVTRWERSLDRHLILTTKHNESGVGKTTFLRQLCWKHLQKGHNIKYIAAPHELSFVESAENLGSYDWILVDQFEYINDRGFNNAWDILNDFLSFVENTNGKTKCIIAVRLRNDDVIRKIQLLQQDFFFEIQSFQYEIIVRELELNLSEEQKIIIDQKSFLRTPFILDKIVHFGIDDVKLSYLGVLRNILHKYEERTLSGAYKRKRINADTMHYFAKISYDCFLKDKISFNLRDYEHLVSAEEVKQLIEIGLFTCEKSNLDAPIYFQHDFLQKIGVLKWIEAENIRNYDRWKSILGREDIETAELIVSLLQDSSNLNLEDDDIIASNLYLKWPLYLSSSKVDIYEFLKQENDIDLPNYWKVFSKQEEWLQKIQIKQILENSNNQSSENHFLTRVLFPSLCEKDDQSLFEKLILEPTNQTIIKDCENHLNKLDDGYFKRAIKCLLQKEENQRYKSSNLVFSFQEMLSVCWQLKPECEDVFSNLNVNVPKSFIPPDAVPVIDNIQANSLVSFFNDAVVVHKETVNTLGTRIFLSKEEKQRFQQKSEFFYDLPSNLFESFGLQSNLFSPFCSDNVSINDYWNLIKNDFYINQRIRTLGTRRPPKKVQLLPFLAKVKKTQKSLESCSDINTIFSDIQYLKEYELSISIWYLTVIEPSIDWSIKILKVIFNLSDSKFVVSFKSWFWGLGEQRRKLHLNESIPKWLELFQASSLSQANSLSHKLRHKLNNSWKEKFNKVQGIISVLNTFKISFDTQRYIDILVNENLGKEEYLKTCAFFICQTYDVQNKKSIFEWLLKLQKRCSAFQKYPENTFFLNPAPKEDSKHSFSENFEQKLSLILYDYIATIPFDWNKKFEPESTSYILWWFQYSNNYEDGLVADHSEKLWMLWQSLVCYPEVKSQNLKFYKDLSGYIHSNWLEGNHDDEWIWRRGQMFYTNSPLFTSNVFNAHKYEFIHRQFMEWYSSFEPSDWERFERHMSDKLEYEEYCENNHPDVSDLSQEEYEAWVMLDQQRENKRLKFLAECSLLFSIDIHRLHSFIEKLEEWALVHK